MHALHVSLMRFRSTGCIWGRAHPEVDGNAALHARQLRCASYEVFRLLVAPAVPEELYQETDVRDVGHVWEVQHLALQCLHSLRGRPPCSGAGTPAPSPPACRCQRSQDLSHGKFRQPPYMAQRGAMRNAPGQRPCIGRVCLSITKLNVASALH